jgi:hypothetical protein
MQAETFPCSVFVTTAEFLFSNYLRMVGFARKENSMKSTLAVLVVLSMTMIAGTEAKSRFHFSEAPEVAVTVINAPNTPAQLAGASMFKDTALDLYQVKFRVKNASDSLDRMRLLLISVTGDGVVKSGETICQATSLGAGRDRTYAVPVASKFDSVGDHAVLAFLRLRQAHDQEWTLAPRKILDAMAANQTITDGASLDGALGPNILCDPSFCSDCKQTALDVCGSRGVHSFQCSINNCSCNFTCNGT